MIKYYLQFSIIIMLLLSSITGASDDLFSSDDIFELEYVSETRISPDGEKIIYVRQAYDKVNDRSVRSLWMYDVENNKHFPLYADQHNYRSPVWAKDNNRFAFISNRTGSEQVHVHWLQQNKNAVITDVEKSVSNLTWSPDGTMLAFTMEVAAPKSDFAKSVKLPKKPKDAKWSKPPVVIERARYQADGRGMLTPAYRHLFIVPALGGSAKQLTTKNYQHFGSLAWTPDGQSILFNSNQSDNWEYEPNDSNLYQININSAKLTPVTSMAGREFNPKFSPDGKRLAFLSRTDAKVPYKNTQLMVMDVKSKKVTNISNRLDRSIAQFEWRNNKGFYIQYDDNGMRTLRRYSLSGKDEKLLSDLSGTTLGRPYISGQFSVSNNGSIAYTKGDAQNPANLGYWSNNKSKQLTDLNADILNYRQLGEVESLEFTSSFDNETIQGWYIKPPKFDPEKKYPLLVEIHGGPHLAYGPHFTAELQRYAAEGFVVLYVNHRGSTSYGERFALLLEGKYSSAEDFADHNSGVDAMIKKGFIDPDQLYIAGGSAGGIATAYAIGLTNRFKAAVITKPVINWISKVLTADSYLNQIPNQFPGLPWEHLEHYWKRSPLSLVGNVTTPSLIMTGEEDRRTPMSESEQFYQALKLRKIDTALVRIPGSSHGIAGRPSRMITKIEYTIAWLNQYRND